MTSYSIGMKIKLLREFRKLLQKELADKVGITASVLSAYEADDHSPGINVLKKIAAACNMHPVYFFDNLTPIAYHAFLGDFEFTHQLHSLPDQVQKYFKVAIKAAYAQALIDQNNPLAQTTTESIQIAQGVNGLDGYFHAVMKMQQT